MTKKEILRTISFVLVVCITLFILCDLFEQENGSNTERSFNTYRNLEEDIVDAVFIGTSGVSVYWISPLAYDEYGMTVYNLGVDALPAWLYISMIEEAMAYQTPELFLLDIRPFTAGDISRDKMDAHARVVLDAMAPLSENRFKTGLKTMQIMHSEYPEAPCFDISYLLSIVKYHPKASDSGYRISHNLGQRSHKYCGFRLDSGFSAVVKEQPGSEYDPNAMRDLNVLCEASLYELLDYIRDRDLQVLFVDTPKVLGNISGSVNRIAQILEDEGFDFLTHVDPPKDESFPLEIDYETDFFNRNHVNFYGAEKYTRALATYLDSHYDLPDRREDPGAEYVWAGIYQRLREDFEQIKRETEARGNQVIGDPLEE